MFGELNVGKVYDEHGVPSLVLSIEDNQQNTLVEPFVLEYASIQELVSVFLDYLIEVDEVHETKTVLHSE